MDEFELREVKQSPRDLRELDLTLSLRFSSTVQTPTGAGVLSFCGVQIPTLHPAPCLTPLSL